MKRKMAKEMQQAMENLKPEAAYFFTHERCRTALYVFDLKDTSDIVFHAEPFFTSVNAKVDLYPVMTAEDVQKGLEKWMKSQG